MDSLTGFRSDDDERMRSFCFPADEFHDNMKTPKCIPSGFAHSADDIIDGIDKICLEEDYDQSSGEEDDLVSTGSEKSNARLPQLKLPPRFSDLVSKASYSPSLNSQELVSNSKDRSVFDKLSSYKLNVNESEPKNHNANSMVYSPTLSTVSSQTSPKKCTSASNRSSYFSIPASRKSSLSGESRSAEPHYTFCKRRRSRASITGSFIGHRRSHSLASNWSGSETGNSGSRLNAYFDINSGRTSSGATDLSSGEIQRVDTIGKKPSVVYLIESPIKSSFDLDDIIH